MNEQEIIRQFQRQRRAYMKKVKAFFAVFVSGIAIAVAGSELLESEIVVFGGFSMAFLSVLYFVFVTYSAYKCPSCGEVPMASMAGGKGVSLNPDHCAKCGVRLQSELADEYEQNTPVAKFLNNVLPYVIGSGIMLVAAGFLAFHIYVYTTGTTVQAVAVKRYPLSRGYKIVMAYQDPSTGQRKTEIFGNNSNDYIGAYEIGERDTLVVSGDSAYPNSPFYLFAWPVGGFLFGFVFLFQVHRHISRNNE